MVTLYFRQTSIAQAGPRARIDSVAPGDRAHHDSLYEFLHRAACFLGYRSNGGDRNDSQRWLVKSARLLLVLSRRRGQG